MPHHQQTQFDSRHAQAEHYYAQARDMQSREVARLVRKLVSAPARLLNRISGATATASVQRAQ